MYDPVAVSLDSQTQFFSPVNFDTPLEKMNNEKPSLKEKVLRLETLLVVISITFFGTVIYYLGPDVREKRWSTETVRAEVFEEDTSLGLREELAKSLVRLPSKYRLMHYYDALVDVSKSRQQHQHIRCGRIPVLFVHGNAGPYELMATVGSMLPIGKWPPQAMLSQDTFIPALTMTMFSADLNEEANIHSGKLLYRQAVFVNISAQFLKDRFVSYYGGGTKRSCGVSVINAEKDFESVALPSDKRPENFCTSVWSEVDSVAARGIWLVGHSMGGIVAKLASLMVTGGGPTIAGIITINTPHRYPPLFFDSTLLHVYHELNTSSKASVPIVSISSGPRDEQVFFESTIARTTNAFSLMTTHMFDCGVMFDHNSLLWSVEFVEPFVETFWRIHNKLTVNASVSVKEAMSTSFASVFDSAKVNRCTGVPDAHSSLKLFVPAFPRQGAALVLPVRLDDVRCIGRAEENVSIGSVIQSPLFLNRSTTTGPVSLVFLTPQHANATVTCVVSSNKSEQDLNGGFSLSMSWSKTLNVSRGDTFLVSVGGGRRSSDFFDVLIAPIDLVRLWFGRKRDTSLEEHAVFLRIPRGEEVWWRTYGTHEMVVLFLHNKNEGHVVIRPHPNILIGWINGMIARELGPLTLWLATVFVSLRVGSALSMPATSCWVVCLNLLACVANDLNSWWTLSSCAVGIGIGASIMRIPQFALFLCRRVPPLASSLCGIFLAALLLVHVSPFFNSSNVPLLCAFLMISSRRRAAAQLCFLVAFGSGYVMHLRNEIRLSQVFDVPVAFEHTLAILSVQLACILSALTDHPQPFDDISTDDLRQIVAYEEKVEMDVVTIMIATFSEWLFQGAAFPHTDRFWDLTMGAEIAAICYCGKLLSRLA